MDLGALTPLFVLLANAVWGVAAAWWVRENQGVARAGGLF